MPCQAFINQQWKFFDHLPSPLVAQSILDRGTAGFTKLENFQFSTANPIVTALGESSRNLVIAWRIFSVNTKKTASRMPTG
jgi:hypothetical protein